MPQTLLLVDGSSYLYRAFHAMPDMRNARGEPTGALYGVVNMLRRLRQDHKADYLACIFDARGRTFREELYPPYKAHRPPMPADLAAQIEPIYAAVQALGWPLFAIEGIEADDVIGTLATRASRLGVSTIISTGDKDLAQLVDEHVELINTMSNERLDVAGVRAKFGVPPDRIIDYLMLTGDAVDNVPGVDKVGPKTAARWLAEYGSIEALVLAADRIGGKAGENLRAALPQFPLTRKLLTVRRDCELGFEGLESLLPRAPDEAALLALYERYGFRSWLRELSGDARRIPEGDSRTAAIIPEAPASLRYDCVTDWAAFDAWFERIKACELVAIDTETTSLNELDARIVGLAFCTEPGLACYIPLAHRHPEAAQQLPLVEVLERFKPWFEDASAAKVLQHAKYDAHVLANHGITLRGIAHDTMLQSYVLESHKPSKLQELAQRHLGLAGISYESICGKGAHQIGFDEVALDVATRYSAEDTDFTLRVHQVLWPKIKGDAGLARIYTLELQTSEVLTAMERHGVLIDDELLVRQSHALGQQMLQLEQEAHALAGQPFNLNSPKQLAEILFERQGLPVIKKTASGVPSTDEEVLAQLAEDHPLPRRLLDYRSLAKLKGTYTDKLPRMIRSDTGRVHTHYAQAAVVTGRLSSSDPNLQNIPVRTPEGRRIREAFVAPPGQRIVSADYSQIELRIMAHLSGDPNLLEAFARGEDVHRATAAEIFGVPVSQVLPDQRRVAKTINFGLIYGMSAFGLASNLSIERDAAKLYIDRYFARYPGVAQYMDRTRQQAREQGYVQTVFGRRLWLPEIRSANGPRRQGAERAAINAPMQGTAADLIKMAMVAAARWIETEHLGSRLVMQVHDELVLEVPEAEWPRVEHELPRLMAGVASLDVPLVAEVGSGPNWEAAH
jgi:DNA polymerase-1